jgi:hypothetical protein
MHVIIAGPVLNGSTPEYLLVFIFALQKWLVGLLFESNIVASSLAHCV